MCSEKSQLAWTVRAPEVLFNIAAEEKNRKQKLIWSEEKSNWTMRHTHTRQQTHTHTCTLGCFVLNSKWIRSMLRDTTMSTVTREWQRTEAKHSSSNSNESSSAQHDKSTFSVLRKRMWKKKYNLLSKVTSVDKIQVRCLSKTCRTRYAVVVVHVDVVDVSLQLHVAISDVPTM